MCIRDSLEVEPGEVLALEERVQVGGREGEVAVAEVHRSVSVGAGGAGSYAAISRSNASVAGSTWFSPGTAPKPVSTETSA